MCIELKIECTKIQPRKKRGPKNRYVQKLRVQLDGNVANKSDDERHDLELIAPSDILHAILNDWFDWIHPVAPILLRNQFMRRVNGGEGSDRDSSTSFILLLASVCAATVASLRRRRKFYDAVTVEHCLEVAERLKLSALTSIITLDRALTLYNFSIAVLHEHGMDSALGFRLFGGSSVSVAYLLHHQIDCMSFVDQQVLKRLYWLIYAAQCTTEMHGRRQLILRHAHESVVSLLPRASSDEGLLHGPISTPTDVSSPDYSYIPGLNALSQLFLIWQSSQATSSQTMDNLQEHILRAHAALINLPSELAGFEGPNQIGYFGFNVQKVNLKVTQLHVRANLLEQMNALAIEQGILITPDVIIDERHLVVEELLDLLFTMPEEVFDANGYSIVPKIRDIGSALLDELRTGSHGRTLQASINLDKLLAKLGSLDFRPAASSLHL